MIVLGIETSCDETAASVCVDGKIVSSVISSQEIHEEFGGVVPELASREHEYLLNTIVNRSLEKVDFDYHDLDGIAVTQGPGLAGTLLTGICFAKGLSQGLSIPIIAINHLEAHIFANFIADPELEFPFICLLVSGGHTQLWLIENINEYKLLGETLDDAAGEAFDKGARILKLGYPGGPVIEKSAERGKPNAIKFPRGLIKSDSFDFSFSGLK
ncbi:MAG: tRNA (adenosine(37)-N6)-threonylcarbamoyltransferase complex transferase subunit TsaD, partial [Candidatus Marinimicrobia bacterium]|nr:tRNA (adenosine(37)-N6)-threonylcarbamoyltransferase complex transferase subunit TsaD [Candidatus Neomarinimicrobiota bacterium]